MSAVVDTRFAAREGRRVCLVTGAAAGIGAAVAQRFARDGADLVLLDRDAAGLKTVAGACREVGAQALGIEADLAGDAWLPQVSAVLDGIGRLDVLVNNAGIGPDNAPDDTASLERILRINLDAPVRLTAACLAYMRRGGRIVHVASILARMGNPRNTGYCTSKHGLLGHARALAMDLAPRGITVNAVLPGFVDTPMFRRELQLQAEQLGTPFDTVLRNARRRVPLRRFVQGDDVAAAVAFLASEGASAITAQSLVVDGGATCGA